MFIRIPLLLLITTSALANIDTHFEQLKKDPNALYHFLHEMPKGGELHYHLAGGAYPQAMLQLAKNNQKFCLDLENNAVQKREQPCEVPTKLLSKKGIYERLLKAWTMIGFKAKDVRGGHDHFFASFMKFMPIVKEYHAHMLKDVVERAANQNEQYLEIMVLTDNAVSTQLAPKKLNWNKLDKQRNKLLANPAFQQTIDMTVSQASHILSDTHHLLNCQQNPEQKACQVLVRFHYYVLREQPIEKLFAQALNGFEAANRKGPFVGVNLVQPEDGPISMRDYQRQMAVFQYLHQVYPNVHISLHAGELSARLVPQSGLTSHVHDAIQIGNAERIGHGVDILSEHDATGTMKTMKERNIAVEINLSSNEAILGISGKEHPLLHYLAAGVPVVLSTDDEGILQTNLTQQYMLATTMHHLNYATIKQINRNALTYSFLPGKSLWQDASTATPVPICSNLNSRSCQLFVAQNPKAAQQRLLEVAITEFESKYR
jgi:adenosine deaminase